MFDWLTDLARSEWAYAVVAGVVVADALIGVLPAETVLHAAGVGAAQGNTSVVVIIAIATVAAVLADLLAYTVGAKWGTTLRDKFIRSDRIWSSEKTKRRFEALREQLDERPWIISISRFVPALRTLTMYAAGSLEFPRRRFLAYEIPGAVAWAAYNTLLGYFLGLVFQDASFWVPFAISVGIAAVLSLVFELIRRARLDLGESEESGERG